MARLWRRGAIGGCRYGHSGPELVKLNQRFEEKSYSSKVTAMYES